MTIALTTNKIILIIVLLAAYVLLTAWIPYFVIKLENIKKQDSVYPIVNRVAILTSVLIELFSSIWAFLIFLFIMLGVL
jgi:hypothetical protein